MPGPVVAEAMEQLAADRDTVIREARHVAVEAGAPPAPELGAPRDGVDDDPEDDDTGEDLDDDLDEIEEGAGEEDDAVEAPSGESGRSVIP